MDEGRERTPPPTRRQRLSSYCRDNAGAWVVIALVIGGLLLYGHYQYDQGQSEGRRDVCTTVLAMNGMKYGDAVRIVDQGDPQTTAVAFKHVPMQCLDMIFQDLKPHE